MWWAIVKYILDKNGSPAWERVNNIMSIANMANSAKSKFGKATGLGESYNSTIRKTNGTI